jgi:hypothetical protein
MKVFIVTSGEYSDYGIERVFTDKSKAEAYSEWLTDSNGVDEYDTSDNDVIVPLYCVEFRYNITKEISPKISIQKTNSEDVWSTKNHTFYNDYGANDIWGSRTFTKQQYKGDEWAKEKVTKICYDLATQIKAWISDGLTDKMIKEMLNGIE